MLFAFSTNAFKKFSLSEAIKSIAQIGYDGVEVLCDVPHAYPQSFSPKMAKDAKGLLSDLKLGVSNLNAFTLFAIGDTYHPSWIEDDVDLSTQRLNHTENCIRLAKLIGAKNISTEPGGPVTDGMSKTLLLKIFVQRIKKAADLAEALDVKLLVEPEPGLLIENSSEFINFIKQLDSDKVGLNFDIGHFYCVREKPESLVFSLSEYTGHYHIEDISASRAHEHLQLGHGSINLKSVVRAIEQSGYRGFVTVELYPYQDEPAEAAKSAFDYLTNHCT